MYKVNPTAMLLAIRLMLNWLGEMEPARALEKAIAEVIEAEEMRTYDLGGDATTLEMAEAIVERM
jgi:isocitrate/isopropylmalate dehydrogenase